MRYGFRCPCHGVQMFDTKRQRDVHAITDECTVELFRVDEQGTDWMRKLIQDEVDQVIPPECNCPPPGAAGLIRICPVHDSKSG